MTTLPEPLPRDAVLLHIGPHKTGTSAIQSALNAVRDELAERGVVYLGGRRHREQGPLAALNRTGRAGIRKPTRGDWDKLLHDVRDNPSCRVVLSSERYCWARKTNAMTIVGDLGPDRVHVVITLRRLDRILPSQWQMSVQGGLTSTFDQWLQLVFSETDPRPAEAQRFWRRHAHGQLVRRWVAAAGVENVTVIVVDDKDHSMLPNAFAELLDLPPGLIRPIKGKGNRSLTAGEVELVRLVNEAFAAHQWTRLEHAQFVRRGLSSSLRNREPERDETRISTPPWAVELAGVRTDSAIAAIRASGVRVIGDLDSLRIGPGGARPRALRRGTGSRRRGSARGHRCARGRARGERSRAPPRRPTEDPETTPAPARLIRSVGATVRIVAPRRVQPPCSDLGRPPHAVPGRCQGLSRGSSRATDRRPRTSPRSLT